MDDMRLILLGLIRDTGFLSRIKSRVPLNDYPSVYSKTVAKWCYEYFEKYSKAPNSYVYTLFADQKKTMKESDAELIEKLLNSLAVMEYDENNTAYLLDKAQKEFKRLKMRTMLESIETLLDQEDEQSVSKAESLINDYTGISINETEGFNPFRDRSVIYDAFEKQFSPLFYFGGAVGEFLNEHLVRDNFISFLGPEKRGKSWLLLEMAMRAVFFGRRVAYFEAGDNSQAQLLKRMYCRLTAQVMGRNSKKVQVVKEMKHIGGDEYDFLKTTNKERPPLNVDAVIDQCNFLMKMKFDKTNLRVSTHSNTSLSVDMIRTQIESWHRVDGFLPDVIIIDYADILLMPKYNDYRHQINELWKKLRSLSQEFHSLLITATQADSKSYSKRILDMSNFSEDKRKLSHITGMIGINQTPREKEQGVLRLNWAALREGDSHPMKCVAIATQFSIARAITASCWVDDKSMDKGDDDGKDKSKTGASTNGTGEKDSSNGNGSLSNKNGKKEGIPGSESGKEGRSVPNKKRDIKVERA